MFFWSRANARLVAQVRRNRLRSRDSERLATLAHARGNRHQRRRRSGKSHSKRSSPHHHTRRRVVRKRLRARVMRRSRFDMLLDRKLNLFPLTRLKILLSHYPPPLLSLIFTFDGMLLILSSLLHRWGVRDGQWLMLLLEMMEHHKWECDFSSSSISAYFYYFNFGLKLWIPHTHFVHLCHTRRILSPLPCMCRWMFPERVDFVLNTNDRAHLPRNATYAASSSSSSSVKNTRGPPPLPFALRCVDVVLVLFSHEAWFFSWSY